AVSGGLDQAMRLWEVDSGRELPFHDEIEKQAKVKFVVRNLAFLPGTRRFLAGTDTGALLIVDISNYPPKAGIAQAQVPGLRPPIQSIAVAADGSRIAVAGTDATAYVL